MTKDEYIARAEEITKRATAALNRTDEKSWRHIERFFDEAEMHRRQQLPSEESWRLIGQKERHRKRLVRQFAKDMCWKYYPSGYDRNWMFDGKFYVAADRYIDHPEFFKIGSKVVAMISHSYNRNPMPPLNEVFLPTERAEVGELPPLAIIRLPRSWYYPRPDGRDLTTAYLFARLDA